MATPTKSKTSAMKTPAKGATKMGGAGGKTAATKGKTAIKKPARRRPSGE